jgi:hypothetical protein
MIGGVLQFHSYYAIINSHVARFFSPKCHPNLKRFKKKKTKQSEKLPSDCRPGNPFCRRAAGEERDRSRERHRALARAREDGEENFVFLRRYCANLEAGRRDCDHGSLVE